MQRVSVCHQHTLEHGSYLASQSALNMVIIVFKFLCTFFHRKANSLFEKNAAPILHLAGIEVKVIKVLDFSVLCFIAFTVVVVVLNS